MRSSSAGPRALVTGGAGFIGSHLVDRLVQEGFQVAVADDLSSGHLENVNPGARFHRVDLTDPALGEVFEEERPEYVFHLAAQASVIRSIKDPKGDVRVNVLGSLNLLEQCQRFGVGRVVVSSTGGALYGDPQILPCPEDHPVRPFSPYGVNKYAVEGYTHCFSLQTGFPYTILRYANVYGPRQDPDGEAGVVAIFCKRMLAGDPVTIYGDGRQERDFVYVADIVEANLLAVRQKQSATYNIGTGVSVSVNTIFSKLAQVSNYRLEPIYEPSRQGEVYKISLDGRKAQEELGWAQGTDLETGLGLTVDYFRNRVGSG